MNLTPAQLSTPVYVYIKQDHEYAGLLEAAVGRLTLQHLYDLMNDDGLSGFNNDADRAIRTALNAPPNVGYSFMIDLEEVIGELVKGNDWSEMDETGYIAFSLKSTSDAKKEVKRMVMKEAGFDEDEDD